MTERALRHIVTTQMPGVDGTGITTAEKVQLVSDVNAANTGVNVMSALRFDPASPMYGAVRSDTEPSNAVKAANRAAIQLAADDAAATNGTLVLKGRYWIDDTVTFECHVDGFAAEVWVTDNTISPVIQVGYPAIKREMYDKLILLPDVRERGRSNGDGWPVDNIGVRISNTYHCQITTRGIRGFRRGLVVHAYNTGNVYNNYYLGIFVSNFIGLDIEAKNGGWVNQNVHVGGRFHFDSSEGSFVPGTRHIRIERVVNSSDNLTFLGTSLEGAPEYPLEHGGRWNSFINCRWELHLDPGPRILALDGSHNLTVDGGYFVDSLQIVGPSPNSIIRGAKDRRTVTGHTHTMVVANTSWDTPALTMMAGSNPTTAWTRDPDTDWTWKLAARNIEGKWTTDTHPRIKLDGRDGRIYFGDGSSEPGAYITKSGIPIDAIGIGGGLRVSGDWTRPLVLGSTYIWEEGSNLRRKHGSPPTSSTDGTVW